VNAERQPEGSLLLTYDSSRWSKCAIGLTLLLLAVIEWEQRWGFRRRAGILKFADVQHVSVDVPIGDDGVPSRRIVFHLSNGNLLPVTVGYRPDTDNTIANAAEAIRTVLGQAPSNITDSLRALIAKGQTISAIKLLREHEGISLAEAKRRVEEMIHQEYT
jgi:hypothetical protein